MGGLRTLCLYTIDWDRGEADNSTCYSQIAQYSLFLYGVPQSL